jgi:cyclopropane-fatty-acyl-phospholipid synthase
MNSSLYMGQVEHERFHPTVHQLNYNLYVYALDLAELDLLDRRLPLFGYNRSRPVALHDRDYLAEQPGTIRHKLMDTLTPHIPTDKVNQVYMVTSPRLLGHVFNPVSFYYCFDDRQRLIAAVAEVNNTFGEKHVYVLPGSGGGDNGFPARYQADKAFHVSPFNTMGGTYAFRFGDIRRELDVQIDLHRDGEHIMRARLQGQPRPLTSFNHLKTLLRHPIRPHLTIPRIYWEAYKLHFRRRLTYHDKPVPRSAMTVRRLPPTTFQRYSMKLMLNYLSGAHDGWLRIHLPDGSRRDFGSCNDSDPVHMHIHDYRFFSRVVLGSDIGLGESYMAAEWDADDIAGVIAFFIRNRDRLKDGEFKESLLTRFLEKLRFLSRANTLIGSRRNIRQHYDLSNDFFQTFLDDSMAYSCAVFSRPGERLHAAQKNKFHAIMNKARLHTDDHVLEIGCGWGGFAIEAVRRTGCRVTGITISREQYALARQRVREAGLDRPHPDSVSRLPQDAGHIRQNRLH